MSRCAQQSKEKLASFSITETLRTRLLPGSDRGKLNCSVTGSLPNRTGITLEGAHQTLVHQYQEEARQLAEQNAYAHRVYNDLLEHRAQNERMRKRTADLQAALRQADEECNRLRGGDANLIRQLQHQHAQDAGLIQQLQNESSPGWIHSS